MEFKIGDKANFKSKTLGEETGVEVVFNELHTRVFGTGLIIVKAPILGQFPSSKQINQYGLDANRKYLFLTNPSELSEIPKPKEETTEEEPAA